MQKEEALASGFFAHCAEWNNPSLEGYKTIANGGIKAAFVRSGDMASIA